MSRTRQARPPGVYHGVHLYDTLAFAIDGVAPRPLEDITEKSYGGGVHDFQVPYRWTQRTAG